MALARIRTGPPEGGHDEPEGGLTRRKADSTSDTGPLTAIPLNDHLQLIAGAGGNVLLVSGPDGLVMINGGRSDRSGVTAKTVSAQAAGRRLTTVFKHRLVCGPHRIE